MGIEPLRLMPLLFFAGFAHSQESRGGDILKNEDEVLWIKNASGPVVSSTLSPLGEIRLTSPLLTAWSFDPQTATSARREDLDRPILMKAQAMAAALASEAMVDIPRRFFAAEQWVVARTGGSHFASPGNVPASTSLNFSQKTAPVALNITCDAGAAPAASASFPGLTITAKSEAGKLQGVTAKWHLGDIRDERWVMDRAEILLHALLPSESDASGFTSPKALSSLAVDHFLLGKTAGADHTFGRFSAGGGATYDIIQRRPIGGLHASFDSDSFSAYGDVFVAGDVYSQASLQKSEGTISFLLNLSRDRWNGTSIQISGGVRPDMTWLLAVSQASSAVWATLFGPGWRARRGVRGEVSVMRIGPLADISRLLQDRRIIPRFP